MKVGPVDIALASCPCCGGEAVCENFVLEAIVRCTRCRLTVKRQHSAKSDTGIDLVIAAWNKRASGESP